jgi:hypothetical protein
MLLWHFITSLRRTTFRSDVGERKLLLMSFHRPVSKWNLFLFVLRCEQISSRCNYAAAVVQANKPGPGRSNVTRVRHWNRRHFDRQRLFGTLFVPRKGRSTWAINSRILIMERQGARSPLNQILSTLHAEYSATRRQGWNDGKELCGVPSCCKPRVNRDYGLFLPSFLRSVTQLLSQLLYRSTLDSLTYAFDEASSNSFPASI